MPRIFVKKSRRMDILSQSLDTGIACTVSADTGITEHENIVSL